MKHIKSFIRILLFFPFVLGIPVALDSLSLHKQIINNYEALVYIPGVIALFVVISVAIVFVLYGAFNFIYWTFKH